MDINRGLIEVPQEAVSDLKQLAEADKYLDYMKKIHAVSDNYGETVFPHCPCDSRKHGHVIVVLTPTGLKLKACTLEGEPESQVVEFAYEDIEKVEVDDDEMTCIVEVKIENKPNRKIKIFTGFVSSSSLTDLTVQLTLNPQTLST